MKMNTKILLIIPFLWALFISGIATRCWAEDALVLTVRPELLTKNKDSSHPLILGRNPFSWPTYAPDNLINHKNEETYLAKKINATFGNIPLGAILWSTKSPWAIINNKIIGEKETSMGVFVDKIKKYSVILKKENMTYELTLNRKTIDFNQ